MGYVSFREGNVWGAVQNSFKICVHLLNFWLKFCSQDLLIQTAGCATLFTGGFINLMLTLTPRYGDISTLGFFGQIGSQVTARYLQRGTGGAFGARRSFWCFFLKRKT